MEWKIEIIIKSKIITYTRKGRWANKEAEEHYYFVKWAQCSDDENTWEPPEWLVNTREIVEKFDIERLEMPEPNLDESYENCFPQVVSKCFRFLPLRYCAHKGQ